MIGQVGVVGNREGRNDNLGYNFAQLLTEPIHVLCDPLVTEREGSHGSQVIVM